MDGQAGSIDDARDVLREWRAGRGPSAMPPRRGPPPPPPPRPPAPAPPPASTPMQPVGHGTGSASATGGLPLNGSTGNGAMSRAARPGYGTSGQKITVKANTFGIHITEASTKWYKHEVIFTIPARTMRDGTIRAASTPPKSLLWKIWAVVQNSHANLFGGATVAFDGRHAAYSNKALPNDSVVIDDIQLPDGRSSRFSVRITNPVEIPLNDVRNYLARTGARANPGSVNDALQALNVVFRHMPSLLFVSTATSFFPLPAGSGSFVDVGGGIDLWRGFFQSVRPCQFGLLLNLDTTSAAFVKPGNLLDLLASIADHKMGRRVDRNSILATGGALSPQDFVLANRLLRKVRITIDRGNLADPQRRTSKATLNGGIVTESARTHCFDVGGRSVTVEQFFRETYNTQLAHPNAPLVEVKRGVLVPAELVTIDPGTKWHKRLTSAQQGLASSFQILDPPVRLREILAIRNRVLRQDSVPFATNFGLSLDPEPIVLEARKLDPPRVEYRNGGNSFVSVLPRDGGWQQKKSGPVVHEKLITPAPELNSMVVIVPRATHEREARDFFGAFLRACVDCGLRISPKVLQGPPGTFHVRSSPSVASTIGNALHQAGCVYGSPCQVVFWLFESETDVDYDRFKYETVCRGIASQAFVLAKLKKNMRSFAFHLNCALKLNAKLGGFNFRLAAQSISPFRREALPMVFGADLSHQDDKPSIVAMCATMHDQGILTEEEIKIQALREPPATTPEGRARKEETIVELESIVYFLLKRRVESSSRWIPDRLVFFRDGVSDSEVEAAVRLEVTAVRRAFQRIQQTYLDPKTTEHQTLVSSLNNKIARAPPNQRLTTVDDMMKTISEWSPKLTFVICVKRHHIRAFAEYGNRIQNIEPGTVIDSGITDGYDFDLYGAAHKGIKGTTRATKYHILVDDNQLSADAIQSFVNEAAHTYQRCNRAISLPATVGYADLIARRVRSWFGTDGSYNATTATSQPSTPQSRQNDLRECRQMLASTVAGRNAFRSYGGPPKMWWL
ncbi:hypothetical protein JCM10212_002401 [Sporobolomyces blumeae]